MKKYLFVLFILALGCLPVLSASAATFQAGESVDLALSAGNAYVAGSSVNVSGKTDGDLYLAGGNVMASGAVGSDFTAVGGTLNLSAPVAGDLRVAGGNITVSSAVGGEILIAGGQVSVSPSTEVSGAANIYGGTINFSGKTDKDLDIKGDKVYINGTVGGNLIVKAEEITLGPDAAISGNFDYSSPKEAVMEEGSKIGGITNFTPIERKGAEGKIAGILTIALLLKIVSIFVISLIIFYAWKRPSQEITERASAQFWKEVLRGFLVLVAVPVAAIICFITVIGIPVGFMLMFAYLALMISTMFFGALVFARLVLDYILKRREYELNWWVIIVAVIALTLIKIIPIAGGIVAFILFLATFGTLTERAYLKLKD